MIPTDKVEVGFKDVDAAILVGSMPRKEGMERKDLLKANVAIFKTQGAALDKFAKKTVKVTFSDWFHWAETSEPSDQSSSVCFQPSVVQRSVTRDAGVTGRPSPGSRPRLPCRCSFICLFAAVTVTILGKLTAAVATRLSVFFFGELSL